MDDPVDKPERRSGTSYFPGAFGYFIIYVYTTGCSSAKCNRSDHHDLFDTPTLPGKVLPRKMTDHLDRFIPPCKDPAIFCSRIGVMEDCLI